MFALALALYIAMTRNGNWEGKGKGKHWWQNMEEMGARAKTIKMIFFNNVEGKGKNIKGKGKYINDTS